MWVTRYRSPKGEGGLCEVGDHGLHCYGAADGVPARYGVGLAEDAAGNLWFAAENLDRWKPGTQAVQYFASVAHPDLNDVVADHSGDVWATMSEVGPQFGVRYFHNGIWGEFSTAGFRSSTLRSSTLFVDGAGAVWIGTNNDGVYRVWNGGVDHFSRADGLSGHDIAFIYEDHEGNLWVSTDSGVDLFRNTPVTTYSMDQGLTSYWIPTVLAAGDGTVWAGESESVGEVGAKFADILRPGPNPGFSKGPRVPGKIGAMFQDHLGNLWLAPDTGLFVYDRGRVEGVISQNGHVLREHILTICEDTAQIVLALTKTQLLRIKDRHIIEAIELPTPLPSGGYLSTNPRGGIWIVGQREGGITLFQNGVMQEVPLPASARRLSINAIIADHADLLMLASTDGLFRWNGNTWDVLDETNGLPCNQLLGAIKDHDGSLWLPADCGYLKMESSVLQRWRENPKNRPWFTLFDALDGANPGTVTNLEPKSSLGPDGKVWFANGHEIQMIDPNHIYRNLLAPPVHVDQFIADNKSFQPADPQLPPNTHNLEIHYTAPSFSVPQKVLFRYFLEGHDKRWQAPVSRRQAFYTDLPPGNYRFHVVACNNSGVWNETGDIATFVVDPTFYQTVWFKTLLAIAAAALLWVLYHLRLRQATASVQNRLMAQMEERERIARELHDTLLQGFQGITLRVQGVAKNMPVQEPLRKMLDEVLDRADGVLREARQRVRNLRRRTTDENDLADRFDETWGRTFERPRRNFYSGHRRRTASS